MKFIIFFVANLVVIGMGMGFLFLAILWPAGIKADEYHPFSFDSKKTEIIFGKNEIGLTYITFSYEY